MDSDFDFVENHLPPGLSIIEASAGTGKTYALSHLVPRLLLEGSASCLGEILLVTFTNDAARELSERVRQVLQTLDSPAATDEEQQANGVHRLRNKFNSPQHTEILRKALRDIDLLAVSTIHSFCQRTLQSEGTLCGLPTIPELVPDATEFIEPELYDLWKTRIAIDPALAAIASTSNWSLADDLNFFKVALSVEDAETLPPSRDFDAAFEELKATPALFDHAACDALQSLFDRVPKWNATDKGAAYRTEMVRCLRESTTLEAPGFLEAVTAISSASGWINKQSKIGKALLQEASELKAVEAATVILRELKLLLWHWHNHCATRIRRTAQAALQANRQITYDGLVTSLRDALRSPKGPALADRLRARYRVALIDESQDTDPRQFEIFRNAFLGLPNEPKPAEHRLVLIGDPKQAIYGFRGADVSTYLEAKALAGDRVFRLNRTYRSCGPLVAAVNSFFAPAHSLLKDGLEFIPAQSGLNHDTVLHHAGEPCAGRVAVWLAREEHADDYKNNSERLDQIATRVASEIVRLLANHAELVTTRPGGSPDSERRAVRPGDFAVLVSAGYEATAIADALHVRKVPAIVAHGSHIMLSEEAAEILTLLRAINEPRRAGLRFAALATRLLGLDDVALRKIRADGELDDQWLATFERWQKIQERQGIAPALVAIDHETQLSQRLSRARLGERRVTNFRQLTDLLQTASMQLGRKPEHLLRWLSQEMASADEHPSDERQQHLESDAEAVQIVTMHSAKGLEYNLVFCPFLWSFKNPGGVQKLSVSGQPARLVHMELANDPVASQMLHRNALEDRLRLAYVAMTRAKVRLWIYAGEAAGKAPAGALDWLFRHQPCAGYAAWSAADNAVNRAAAHTKALEAMACAHIHVCAPPEQDASVWEQPAATSSAALATQAAPDVPAPWGITSFSSLTREKHARSGSEPTPPRPAARPDEAGAPAGNGFLSARGGALMGTAIHDWIEQWDFREPAPGAVELHLQRYALPAAAHGPSLSKGVESMLAQLSGAILPGLNCTVAEACPLAESSEWHFQLPINRVLTPQLLAAAFTEHGDAAAHQYAPILANLRGNELQGFLQGFMDRLACHEQSWGVIDWKTNKLGSSLDAYGSDSLMECAMQSHYLLQAHLYLVALRRYLGPDIHIAGAWLIFLRAVRAGTDDGILHIQPKPALLAALDSLFFKPADFTCTK